MAKEPIKVIIASVSGAIMTVADSLDWDFR